MRETKLTEVYVLSSTSITYIIISKKTNRTLFKKLNYVTVKFNLKNKANIVGLNSKEIFE